MCGLAGAAGGSPLSDVVLKAMHAATAALALRGPDGAGTWVAPDRSVALAHTRLSIRDLTDAGAQPFVVDDRHLLVYNGELYNEALLLERLRDVGVRTRSTCDTETLGLHLRRFGTAETVRLLDGMYAFAWIDLAAGTCTLVRDRFGEKPMSYGVIDGVLVFASDIRVLAPLTDRVIDPDALELYLGYGCVPAPFSILKGIKKLLPGEVIEFALDDGARVTERRRNRLINTSSVLPHDSEETWNARVRAAMDESVTARLVSDAPIGVLLSGGYDSTLVAATARRVTGASLPAFTIGFANSSLDESRYARPVAAALGLDHHVRMMGDSDAIAMVPRLIDAFDEPFADSSALATLLVSDFAADHVKVVLGGDGGDELFAGYNRHAWLGRVLQAAERLPRSAVRAAKRFPAHRLQDMQTESWRGPRWLRQRSVGYKLAKLIRTVADGEGDPARTYASLRMLGPAAGDYALEHAAATFRDAAVGAPSLLHAIQRADMASYLSDDILVKTDRASMACSIEMRSPFLDRSLLSLTADAPAEWLVRGGLTKRPVRRMVHAEVPAALMDRPKAGFGVPMHAWLRGPLRPEMEDAVRLPTLRSLVSDTGLGTAWEEHRDGRADHRYDLWALLCLARWLESEQVTI